MQLFKNENVLRRIFPPSHLILFEWAKAEKDNYSETCLLWVQEEKTYSAIFAPLDVGQDLFFWKHLKQASPKI